MLLLSFAPQQPQAKETVNWKPHCTSRLTSVEEPKQDAGAFVITNRRRSINYSQRVLRPVSVN